MYLAIWLLNTGQVGSMIGQGNTQNGSTTNGSIIRTARTVIAAGTNLKRRDASIPLVFGSVPIRPFKLGVPFLHLLKRA
jgi:hypothetical protein